MSLSRDHPKLLFNNRRTLLAMCSIRPHEVKRFGNPGQSSEGLRKKPVSPREPSERPSGGRKGHKGETLRQIAQPDRIVTHVAAACRAQNAV